jgi:hypothetical protein
MKPNKFGWLWGDHEPRNDPSMTRNRAALLIRAWRNSRTQGFRNFDLQVIRTKISKCYCVKTTKYINDEAGILFIYY